LINFDVDNLAPVDLANLHCIFSLGKVVITHARLVAKAGPRLVRDLQEGTVLRNANNLTGMDCVDEVLLLLGE